MRILLVNLTRFGDLLQSQPLVRDLTAAGHEVGLVCLEQFVAAAELLHGVQVLPPLPGSALLRSVDEDWRVGCGLFDEYARDLCHAFAPDQVLNLTASLPGRLLARRLTLGERPDSPKLHGFGLDAWGFGANSSLWVAFFEASSRLRGCSPYNIVDVFRKMGGPAAGEGLAVLNKPEPAQVEQTRLDLLAEWVACGDVRGSERKPASALVTFQLGASETRRQWPVEHFAELGRLLYEQHGLVPVLLGTKAEQPLADAYFAAGGVGLHRVGRTDLPQLAACLLASRLLVTNDTGTMHLAAGLGVPSLSMFLATAQPWDTGPYLPGCCSLEPDLPCHPCGFGTSCPHGERCRTQITPQCAEYLIAGWLQTGEWPADTCGAGRGTRIWQSAFEASPDGWTRMNLVSLSGHEATDRTVLLRAQRELYGQFLDVEQHDPDACVPFGARPELLAALSEQARSELADTLDEADALLRLLAEQGKLVGVIPSGGQRFLMTLHAVTRCFESFSAFNALGRLWQTTTQERGDDLRRVMDFAEQVRSWLAAWRQML